MQRYTNRRQAGQLLANKLRHHSNASNLIVLGLARGGVPVAAPIASALQCPLDVLVVRKIGLPSQPECAMGALSHHGILNLNHRLINTMQISNDAVETATQKEISELKRRTQRYRDGNADYQLEHKTVILVDDGIATGATIEVAIQSVRYAKAARVVLAVPVACSSALLALTPQVDECICLLTPPDFNAVGNYYTHFAQTSDDEVLDLLRLNRN